MSRIGKEPVKLPKGIKANIQGSILLIESAKAKLSLDIPANVSVEVTESVVTVKRVSDEKEIKALHGTVRALINNMVFGLTTGFKKDLDIIGVGYKAQLKGKQLILNVGFTHTVDMDIPEGLKVTLPNQTHITIEGFDKYMVGQFTANVRAVFPPEPYKGKGIRYSGEEVRKKLGKALAK
jgi:large subunit ribosomal protein L6